MRALCLLAACMVMLALGIDDDGFASKPHIVVLFADNVGWANVGFHRPPNVDPREIVTPNLDRLATEYLQLDRHYCYKFCSPSRSSLLTGRLPFHVNIYNDDPTMHGQGVPTNMTMISAKLRAAGYRTHFIGKWHVGMASRSQNPPQARGFESSLGYFHSENNYYNSTRAQGCDNHPATDLWDTDGPAIGLNGTAYEEIMFGNRAVDIIQSHDASTPLFLYYAFHTSCTGWAQYGEGLQPEPAWNDKFAFVDDPDRRANQAMVSLMDSVVGNITDALHAKGMWDNTLVLWSSDNGGASHAGGGANNWPLRGGYYNNWEGGIRVAALVAGGVVPKSRRGGRLEGVIHEADWYSTFAHLAGVSAVDPAAGVPPVDSQNVWPLITGQNHTSPRTEWPITPLGEQAGPRAPHGGDAAYMLWPYKLIVGRIAQNGWCGQVHPNVTQPWDAFKDVLNCTEPSRGKVGCLFDVLADPNEHQDLALEHPELASKLLQKMHEAEKHWFDPDRGTPDPKGCELAQQTGFWQPFLP